MEWNLESRNKHLYLWPIYFQQKYTDNSIRKGRSFQQIFSTRTIEPPHAKKKNSLSRTPYTLLPYITISPRWIIDLSVKHKTMKLLEGRNFSTLLVKQRILRYYNKSLIHKKIDKLVD